MQVIEESIDVKSMKPSLLVQQLVRTIAVTHGDQENEKLSMEEKVCTFSLTAYC